MHDHPLVSVITIFLNEETFLSEAVESVLAQTYTNWELLLVDDGSTDASTTIAKNYAKQYPGKVIYLDHPDHQNKGMSASRNLAIRHSKGELLSFIDSDDVWLPQKLEVECEHLRNNPTAVLVCSGSLFWYSWTEKQEDKLRDCVQEYPLESNQVIEAPRLFQLFLSNEFYALRGTLVHKSAVEAVGGYEDSFRDMYEDQVFYSKVCLQYPVFFAEEIWYKYRRHPDSCTHQSIRSEDHRIKRGRFLHWLNEYIREKQLDTAEIRRDLRAALWPFNHPVLAKLISQPNKTGLKDLVNRSANFLLPHKAYQWFHNQCRFNHWPPVGWTRFGHLRRLSPIDPSNTNRGTRIDQYYIASFLKENRDLIFGQVMEMDQPTHTWTFGQEQVTHSTVLSQTPGNPEATLLGDLSGPDLLPVNRYDCILLPHTLNLVPDPKAVLRSLYQSLKPNGTLLITVPVLGSNLSPKDPIHPPDLHRFTHHSLRELFTAYFPEGHLSIQSLGNVLSATSFLHGIAAEELKPSELDHHDSACPVILCLTATKPTD